MLGFTKEQEVEYQAQNTEQLVDIGILMIHILLVYYVYVKKWHYLSLMLK
jgi:hypothetical protein